MPLNRCSVLLLLLLFHVSVLCVHAQSPAKDPASGQKGRVVSLSADSLLSIKDTVVRSARQILQSRKAGARSSLQNKRQLLRSLRPDSSFRFPADPLVVDIKDPFRDLLKTKPLAHFDGGYVGYGFNYRSNIDTPYTEKNIAQHNISGQLQVTVAGYIPLQVLFWLRKSNSNIFHDMANVQVAFSGADFRNQLQASMRKRMLALAPSLKDTLTEKLYALKKVEWGEQGDLLKAFSLQRLSEARQILRVPGITYDPGLSDSVNLQREQAIKRSAALLLENYEKVKGAYDRLTTEVDSLRKKYEENIAAIKRYEQLVNGGWQDAASLRGLQNKLGEYGVGNVQLPARYRWLLNVRNFSLGRSMSNYSELTAKNTSVNGINFEYNSWYYVGVSAGAVNYRFRDFVVNGSSKKPQYMYLLRAGIGRLEKNYFIVSYYGGRKQLFATGRKDPAFINLTGIAAETRWQVTPGTYVTAEVAKSMAPDIRNDPAQTTGKFDLSDRSSRAYALHLYSYVPFTGSRVEAFYKHTGANFQSFSSFQTNAALESWYVRAEQGFFKRKLRVAASLRKNEFTNPFLAQAYKSNTVFKSVTASFRARRWPVITVGFQPMSQLTVLDNQVIENRFQTLNGTLYHLYRIKELRTATTVMLNRFYNTGADSGFVYFNATNIYLAQNFFFKGFNANIAVNHTRNAGYTLNVLDGHVQPAISKTATLGVGIKVNNLNAATTKVGAYASASVLIRKDVLYISYEHGYLPGFSKGLVRNEMASIQYTKTF